MDRPPEGDETQLFTWHEASKWDEHWVLLDVPEAKELYRELAAAIGRLSRLPW